MAQLANATLLPDLKLFGHRVFEFTANPEGDDAASTAERLRRAVAEAPRRLTRHAATLDERQATRELLWAFKALSEAVSILDKFPRAAATAVDASALAQEGAELCEQMYDLIA
jgi:hypothetical protein